MHHTLVMALMVGFVGGIAAARPGTLTSDATLAADYRERVDPFWATGVTGSLTATDGTRLAFRKFEKTDERAAIVFVTGWTETAQKYAELLYTLSGAGYSIYTMDNRGMGFSQRLTPNPQKVHVEDYAHYVSDLKRFVDTVVRARPHRKVFFVTHSMGGLIGALYALAHPGDADALVHSSPLWQVNTKSTPEGLALGLAQLGRPMDYIALHRDTTPDAEADYTKQTATHSRPRWDRKVLLWRAVPESFMSGSSNRWLQRTIEATRRLRGGAARDIRAPMLVLSAAHDERVVNAGVESVCKLAARCERHVYADAWHELFIESDAVRNVESENVTGVVPRILQFLERHL